MRFCPAVDAVAGLDRLEQTYPGASQPVRTSLDVVNAVCTDEGEDLVIASAVAIRLGANRPPGDVRVPLSVFVESPQGISPDRTDTVVVPAGASGTVEVYEHRFPGMAGNDDLLARVLYALVPDQREYERIVKEVPRP